MHLLSTLASGVYGAEGGFADIFVRGTARKATHYTGFDGTGASSARVSLDDNGGSELYVDVPVDVVVIDADGVQVRRFTEMVGDSSVEVRSDSFTGSDYDTLQSGAGKPTTLRAVLDKWLDSAGATDFQVELPDGSTANLSAALVSSSNIYFNIASYGAVIDGVTDDSVAIAAAVTAAAVDGGTVFFPAGTTVTGTAITVPANVNLLGAGAESSIIKISSTAASWQFTGAGDSFRTVVALQFTGADATVDRLVDVLTSAVVAFRWCHFLTLSDDNTSIAVAVGSSAKRASFDECDFTVDEGTAISSTITGATGRVDIKRCRFITVEASYSPSLGMVFGECLHLYGCRFDASAATSGTASYILLSTAVNVYASVRCCEFLDSGGCAVTCMTLGTLSASTEFFTEDGNIIPANAANLTLYSATHSGTTITYYAKLGTRESRVKEMSLSATTVALTDVLGYGVISVRTTGAGNHSMTADAVGPMGARLVVLFVNNDTATRTLTFGSNMKGGSFAVASHEAIGLEFVSMVAHNGTSAAAAWYLVGTSGALTTGADSSYTV